MAATTTGSKSGARLRSASMPLGNTGNALAGRARIREGGRAAGLNLPLDHHLLDLGDRLGRIEVLRAGVRAVHDGVAAVEPERILEVVEALAGRLVAAVGEPALGL